jgi:hypothetical protein
MTGPSLFDVVSSSECPARRDKVIDEPTRYRSTYRPAVTSPPAPMKRTSSPLTSTA